MGMYGTEQKIPSDGGGGGETLRTHHKVLSVWRRENELVCVLCTYQKRSQKEFRK